MLTDQFALHPALDVQGKREAFVHAHHARIPDVLDSGAALALHEHLANEVSWQTFILSQRKLYQVTPAPDGTYTREAQDQMVSKALEGATRGFAYFHEADRLFPEDVPEGSPIQNPPRSESLARFHEFVNTEPFLDVCRRVTGLPAIVRADIQATRFRAGHFVRVHHLRPHDASNGARCVAFELNLTTDWQPDWGGLAEVHRGHDYLAQACVPSFNLLDLFCPHYAQWICPVSAHAGAERLAIGGWLYSN